MSLREAFAKQLSQGSPRLLFYVVPVGRGIEVRSIRADELDSCVLVPAADQSHLERGYYLPVLVPRHLQSQTIQQL